jgi:hypothetical protein
VAVPVSGHAVQCSSQQWGVWRHQSPDGTVLGAEAWHTAHGVLAECTGHVCSDTHGLVQIVVMLGWDTTSSMRLRVPAHLLQPVCMIDEPTWWQPAPLQLDPNIQHSGRQLGQPHLGSTTGPVDLQRRAPLLLYQKAGYCTVHALAPRQHKAASCSSQWCLVGSLPTHRRPQGVAACC